MYWFVLLPLLEKALANLWTYNEDILASNKQNNRHENEIRINNEKEKKIINFAE